VSGPPQGAAQQSVLREGRLVAYVWLTHEGRLWRAGSAPRDLGGIGYVDVLCFERAAEATLAELAALARDWDGLAFKLGIEGFVVEPGAVTPAVGGRRF